MTKIHGLVDTLLRSRIESPRLPRKDSYRYPFPPFPASWYHLCLTSELTRGAVKQIHCCGQELAVFRGDDQKVRAVDGYCPHLGAPLSLGKVCGNSLRCAFHGWQYNGQGACVYIPYAQKIPPKARLRSWPVRERNGVIYVYFDPEGREPAWEPPTLPEYDAPDFTAFLSRRAVLRVHPQEMFENSMDVTHFGILHAGPAKEVLSDGYETDGPRFIHKTRLMLKNDKGRIKGPPIVPVPFEITVDGLGLLTTRWDLRTDVYITIIHSFSLRPLDEEHIEVLMRVAVRKLPSRMGTWALWLSMVWDGERTYKQDVPIWEGKRFLQSPLLVQGDGPIMPFRRWARQFYPSKEEACA